MYGFALKLLLTAMFVFYGAVLGFIGFVKAGQAKDEKVDRRKLFALAACTFIALAFLRHMFILIPVLSVCGFAVAWGAQMGAKERFVSPRELFLAMFSNGGTS